MKLSHVLSRNQSDESLTVRKHTPWISSPLDQRAQRALNNGHSSGDLRPSTGNQVLEFDESGVHRSDSEVPIFREHHESSTVELFYDLFFVANLSSFTSNHEITSGGSLRNYIGFFTLLWFTWLQTSLFDVRFSTDSIFNRTAKLVSFGVMTGFSISGAIYDTSNVGENAKAFRAMALILMVSRLTLILQYGVVFWYVKDYQRTLLPLVGTMATLFVSAMVFLGTFWGFPHGGTSFPISNDGSKTYIAWYVMVVVEAFILIAISCKWRVVSFKHTHLVERVGLLTLIIMGEGIIGMTHSVSSILQNSATVSTSDIGTVVASVVLIYFIWVLYFDQIEHDRFGTIRQQIWALLHFPLHVAILLTVEGSGSLILWNIILEKLSYLDFYVPADDIPTWDLGSSAELISYTNETLNFFKNSYFQGDAAEKFFDYQPDLEAIANITAPFASLEWNNTAGVYLDDIYNGVTVSIFQAFNIEIPETGPTNSVRQIDAYSNLFYTVFAYFYIAAGCFLVILAVMYYFGKTHKSRGEYASIAVRIFAGTGLTMGSISSFLYTDAAYNFTGSSWILPIVPIGYFIVIIADNLLVWHTNKTIAHQTSNTRQQSVGTASLSETQKLSGEERGSTSAGESI